MLCLLYFLVILAILVLIIIITIIVIKLLDSGSFRGGGDSDRLGVGFTTRVGWYDRLQGDAYDRSVRRGEWLVDEVVEHGSVRGEAAAVAGGCEVVGHVGQSLAVSSSLRVYLGGRVPRK